MSAIQVAIQRCIDAGWYAELRERASFWLGDFPIDPPDLHAEFSRCAMLPKKDDVRLRALQAVWQFPPWGPPWASTHLERAARDRKNAWVNQGLSPTTQPAAALPPSTVGPSVEPAPPMDEAALEKLIYPHGRLALLRLTRLLWRYAQRLSTLHRARKHAAINRTLTALARQAGLVERPRRGRRKRLPK